MEHFQKTLNVLLEENAVLIGLDSAAQLHFGDYSDVFDLPETSVSLFSLRTLSEPYRFGEHDRERYLTVLQLDILTRGTDPLEAVRIRDKLFSLLDDLRMPRRNWTDPEEPVDAGEIRLKHKDDEPFLLDGGVRAISMTYEAEWWKPRG